MRILTFDNSCTITATPYVCIISTKYSNYRTLHCASNRKNVQNLFQSLIDKWVRDQSKHRMPQYISLFATSSENYSTRWSLFSNSWNIFDSLHSVMIAVRSLAAYAYVFTYCLTLTPTHAHAHMNLSVGVVRRMEQKECDDLTLLHSEQFTELVWLLAGHQNFVADTHSHIHSNHFQFIH